MVKHIKPTAEELDAGIQKSVEELEAEKPKEEPKGVQAEEPQEETPEPKGVQAEPKPLQVEEEPKEDYKKKFVEQGRENIVLHSKNKQINEALEKAMQSPEPTEEELTKKYPDWEMMSEFEKGMAKDSLTNSRRFNALGEITKTNKAIEEWQTKVNSYIDDPKTLIDNSALEGREEEFRLFASKPTRRGVDFEDLTKAFLYDVELKKPKKNKGKMFETGSGGPNDRSKPNLGKISLEEARQLRNTDYNKYRELLNAGKIDNSSI